MGRGGEHNRPTRLKSRPNKTAAAVSKTSAPKMEAAATPLQSVSRKESEGVEGKEARRGADSFKLPTSTFSRYKHATFALTY